MCVCVCVCGFSFCVFDYFLLLLESSVSWDADGTYALSTFLLQVVVKDENVVGKINAMVVEISA